MVKQIIHSAANESHIQNLTTSKTLSAGIIIGHRSGADKDYIARYIECPDKDISNVNVLTVNDIDDSWFSAYASQIALNLPGGVSIAGVFICARQSDAKEVSNKLRTLASRTYKVLSTVLDKCWGFTSDSNSTLWTLVHFSQDNAQAVSVRQFDVLDFKDVGHSIELKKLNQDVAWSKLHATLDVSQCTARSYKTMDFSAFYRLCNRISQARVIIDGEDRPGTQALDKASGQSGRSSKAKKQPKQQVAKTFECEIYLPSSDAGDSNVSEKVVESSFQVRVQGNIIAQAFVSPGTTVKTAQEALKSDAIRSIQQRCLVLSEGLDEAERSSFHQLPMRVLAKDTNEVSGIQFTEYVTRDEPISHCVERFCDFMGISVAEDNVTMQECFADVKTPEVESLSAAGVSSNVQNRKAGSIDSYVVILLIAMLAVVTGLYAFSGK